MKLKSGYYVNKQNQLVILTKNKVSVWSEQAKDWVTFLILNPKIMAFEWEYLGEL